MRERLYRILPAFAGFVLFLAALEVLRRELRTLTWHALKTDVLSMPPTQLLAALAFVILNYAILTGYDFIALASIGRKLPARRVIFTSLLSYAIANNVGFAALSGAAVRHRFYSRFGITGQDLARIVFSCSVTFWLGLFLLGGLSLAWTPLSAAQGLPASRLVVPFAWILATAAPAYLLLTVFRRAPIRLRNLEFPLPPLRLALAQVFVSVADWALAAAALFVLLPPASVSFPRALGAFLGAQLLGLLSHVPGGIGVFEGVMVLLLQPALNSGDLLTSLFVFRILYYLVPLSLAVVALVIDEIHQRRSQASQVTAYLGSISRQFTPQVLAVVTFIAGLVLLFSGATPAAEGRLAFLNRFLPIGVLETSHFLGSLAGVALLLLSQGLARRLDAAYWLTVLGVSVGLVTSLLKGGGYAEAALLALLLAILAWTRSAFDRNAAFFETRFSAPWIVAVLAAVTSSVWLGLFAFKHVEFSSDLWWQFELHAEASRFLRASVGASVALLIFAGARLLGYAPHEAPEPTNADFDSAEAIIRRQESAHPNLVFLRDKPILFDESRSGFVMYGVQGSTWVALGDPVCPPDKIPEFIRLFLERCDDFGASPVFYEVRPENLHHYADFGLTFIKLGEEATVDLTKFTLEGSQASRFRQALRKLDKEGVTFRVLSAEEGARRIAELEAVSDDWLQDKAGGEKGFSLGFFDRQYLSRFPIGVIERGERVLAFANLWQSGGRHEVSADLMRYHRDAPKGIMESLFVCLIVWAKEQGYAHFSLGMAPMSGFEQSPAAPLWTKFGTFLFEHGEPLYNFQGLRAFKEKFDPVWESRYMASSGGFKLPRILADVVALVSGGYRRVFLK